MRRLVAALVGVAVAVTPAAMLAQAPATSSAATASRSPTPPRRHRRQRARACRSRRISRRLQADARARSEGDSPLKLEYFVDVYGTAPALRFFTGQDLRYGAVPMSPPTHADMLFQLTPQAFRSPRVDFLGLAYAAAGAGTRKIEDWRYLRDLRAYQKLVESGRNVPAPQPPRQVDVGDRRRPRRARRTLPGPWSRFCKVHFPDMRITVAHSPDSDDAFMHYGLSSGKVPSEGLEFTHLLADIETLNQAAFAGTYEVSAVSFHAYAHLADKYLLLPHGSSMGDNYGPMVVVRQDGPASLDGVTVAMPGELTSAFLALRHVQARRRATP